MAAAVSSSSQIKASARTPLQRLHSELEHTSNREEGEEEDKEDDDELMLIITPEKKESGGDGGAILMETGPPPVLVVDQVSGGGGAGRTCDVDDDDDRRLSSSSSSSSPPHSSPHRDESGVAEDNEVTDWVSVPFVNIDKAGKMFVAHEAATMLSNHRKPLAVVCITGPARTGKSSAVNTIIGGRTPRELRNPLCGALVGDTTNPCTEGIHAMSIQSSEKLWRRLNVGGIEDGGDGGGGNSFDILVLDSEGTEALNRQSHYNTNLLTLLFLISSTFVYNTKGSIDEAALEKLTTVVQAARRVMSKNSNGSAEEFSLPAFLWLVRDFMLVLADESGRSISSDQYLDAALRITTDMPRDKAMLRRDFARFFRSRGCCTVSIPHSSPDVVRQVSMVDPSLLTAEFRRDMDRVRSVLPFAVRPRVICGTQVTGESLLHVLHIFIAALNKGEVPEVKSSWMQVAEARCQDIVDEGLERLRAEVLSSSCDPLEAISAARAICDATIAKMRVQGLDAVTPQKMIDMLNATASVARNRAVEAWMQRVSASLPHPPPIACPITHPIAIEDGKGKCEGLGAGAGVGPGKHSRPPSSSREERGGGQEQQADDEEERIKAWAREHLRKWILAYRTMAQTAVKATAAAAAVTAHNDDSTPSSTPSCSSSSGGGGSTDILADAVLGRNLADSLPHILVRACEEGEFISLARLAGARNTGSLACEKELEEAREELARCNDELSRVKSSAEVEKESLSAELEAARREIKSLSSETERQSESLNRLETELETMSELRARVSIAEEDMQRIRRDAQAAEERTERELTDLQDELATSITEISELKRSLEVARRKAKEELDVASTARDRVSREMEVYRAESTTKIGMLSSERDRYREETERARQSLLAEKRRSENAAEISRAEIRRERDANKDLSDRLHESEMRVARAEMAVQKSVIALEEIQRKEEEVKDLKEEIAKMRERISRLTGENRAQKEARERLADELRSAKEESASIRAEHRNRANR